MQDGNYTGGNLPTEQVGFEARRQVRGNQFEQEPPIETMGELYQQLFFGDRSNYKEIDKHLSSGYLKESEIVWMHQIADVLRNLELLEDDFDMSLSVWSQFFHRKLNFISMVSKSRAGFAIKEAGTSRIHSDESYMMDNGAEDSKGIMDKLGALLKGQGGGRGRGSSWDSVLPQGGGEIWEPPRDDRRW